MCTCDRSISAQHALLVGDLVHASLPRDHACVPQSPPAIRHLGQTAELTEIANFLANTNYSLKVISTQKSEYAETFGGLKVGDSCYYKDFAGPIDTLIVIGGSGASSSGIQDEELLRWIRRRSAHARRVASVCTGALLLAAAGLLNEKRATTHWRYIKVLADGYSKVLIERHPVFTKDGKYYTTAGVSAGIDLALAFLEEDCGHDGAAVVAREMVLFLRRPGSQAQISTVLAQQEAVTDARLRNLPAWVNARLDQQIDVAALAIAVSMSPRTFARQFFIQFRTTPARWVQSLRVEAAKRMLESQNEPLRAVAKMTGFRDEQALGRAFAQQSSIPPKEYRERFGRARAV